MIRKNAIPNRHAGEEIVLHLRRHWFVFLLKFLFYLFLALIPLGIFAFINYAWPDLLIGDISYPILTVLFFTFYLGILVFAFTAWTDNYLDVWTITTERIINREQNGLFNRVVSELDLYQVQDVTAEQKGFLATIFQYGDVYIQTAGTTERFLFEQVPEPYRIAKIIQKLNEQAQKAHARL